MNGSLVPAGLNTALCDLLPGWVNTVFAQQAEVYSKGSDGLDLVTSVDFAIQDKLEDKLSQLLPGSSVVGEEEYRPFEGSGPLWLVDPLDGTVNFAAGLPAYSVAVALIIENVPVLSAVYDVTRGDLYSAQKGIGARLNGELIVQPSHQAKLAIISSGLLKDFAERAPETLAQLLSGFKLRNFGSQALHLCYAAAGKVSLVASREAKGWDDMAGALIAREAGLQYSSYRSEMIPPAFEEDQKSLCATPQIFEASKALFARSCA